MKEMPTPHDPRMRLLNAALRLFARNGYHKTSTRALAKEAEVNIAAIQYYFGGKAELYQELFQLPFKSMNDISVPMDNQDIALDVGLRYFFSSLLPADTTKPEFKDVAQLIAREEFEPSGVLQENMSSRILPHLNRLLRLLQHHLGLDEIDADIYRLGFSLFGLASIFTHGRAVVADVYPLLVADEKAMDALTGRLIGFSLSIIDGEKLRRRTADKA